jgi:anti-sigma B factor antagonist
VSLTVETHDQGEITILTVIGELDLAAVPGFEAEIHTLVSARRIRLVLDLNKLTFCDSTGLNAFARANQVCEEQGGWLRLTGPHGSVLRVLEVTGMLADLALNPGKVEGQAQE